MERMKTMEAMRTLKGQMFLTDFAEALSYVKNGGKAARVEWDRGNMWIRLVEPEGTSDFDYGMENLPYLEMKTADNKLVPWTAFQTDLLAEDWVLLEETSEDTEE